MNARPERVGHSRAMRTAYAMGSWRARSRRRPEFPGHDGITRRAGHRLATRAAKECGCCRLAVVLIWEERSPPNAAASRVAHLMRLDGRVEVLRQVPGLPP